MPTCSPAPRPSTPAPTEVQFDMIAQRIMKLPKDLTEDMTTSDDGLARRVCPGGSRRDRGCRGPAIPRRRPGSGQCRPARCVPRPRTMAASGWASTSRCPSPRSRPVAACNCRCSNNAARQGALRHAAGRRIAAGNGWRPWALAGQSDEGWPVTPAMSPTVTGCLVADGERCRPGRSRRTVEPGHGARPGVTPVLAGLDSAQVWPADCRPPCTRQRDDARSCLPASSSAPPKAPSPHRAHVATRVQFGRPLSAKQAVRHCWRGCDCDGSVQRGHPVVARTDEHGAARDTRPTSRWRSATPHSCSRSPSTCMVAWASPGRCRCTTRCAISAGSTPRSAAARWPSRSAGT